QFTIVYIPAEEGTELQEWHLDLPQDVDGQIACLTERLRAHFKSKTGAASTDEQKDAFRQQIIKQVWRTSPVVLIMRLTLLMSTCSSQKMLP
ncbi:hypothetical protein DYB37_006080, partial [Aphanomyces astaci]